MSPGSTVRFEASITSVPAGQLPLGEAVVTTSIRPLSIWITASRTAGLPVPPLTASLIFSLGEVHLLQALRGDRQIAHGDVPSPLEQVRDHLAPGGGDAHHVEFNVPGLELLVEIGFEELRHVVGQAALHRAIDEVEGLRVRDEDPNRAPLDHAVKSPVHVLATDLSGGSPVFAAGAGAGGCVRAGAPVALNAKLDRSASTASRRVGNPSTCTDNTSGPGMIPQSDSRAPRRPRRSPVPGDVAAIPSPSRRSSRPRNTPRRTNRGWR